MFTDTRLINRLNKAHHTLSLGITTNHTLQGYRETAVS